MERCGTRRESETDLECALEGERSIHTMEPLRLLPAQPLTAHRHAEGKAYSRPDAKHAKRVSTR
jgi:hypothetical protein